MKLREISLISAAVAILSANAAAAPLVPQKADVVAAKSSPGLMDAGGLIATGMGIFQTIQGINQQFKALEAECVPSVSDVNFVQKMVLEVAKTGVSANDFNRGLGGVQACTDINNYRANEEVRAANTGKVDKCFDAISASAGTINGISLIDTMEGSLLAGFPKVSSEKVQKSGGEMVNVSNMHDIFSVVMGYFGPDDLLANEVANAQKLVQLADKCSEVKVNAARKQAWMGLAQQAIMGISEGTFQANPMDALGVAGAMSGGGGFNELLLGTMPVLMK
jgi:hypothetical protein